MAGRNTETPKVEEIAKSNNVQIEDGTTENNNKEKKVESNNTQVEVESLTPNNAQKESDSIIENKETKNEVDMLKGIIKAFSEDKEWKLKHLHSEYATITNKIMTNYENAINKLKENDGNRVRVLNEDGNAINEPKEIDEDDISVLNEDENRAEEVVGKILSNQPKEVSDQISQMNKVLKEWSENDKAILKGTIKQVENDIANLYKKIPWLEKVEE